MPRALLALEHWQREQAGEAEKLLVNMYGEPDRTNPKRQGRLVTSPGTRDMDTGNVITGNVRALAQSDAFANGKVLILDGTTLRTWVPSTGTFGTITGTVSGTDRADVAFTQTELALLSGGTLYISSGSTIAAESDVDFPSGITSIAAMAQRILLTAGDGKFWYTDVLDAGSIGALNFYTAEASPDNLIAVRVYAEQALLFGSETVEMWYAEPSNADDPFSRSSSVVPVGCYCRDGIAITDKGPIWVAPDLTVRALAGADAPVVSPPWVTRMLAGTAPSDIMASWYSAEGQTFYCLNTSDFCAVWSVGGNWHLRETTEVKEAVVSVTLGNVTLSATGRLALTAVLQATLGNATLSAAGGVLIAGSLEATLGNATLTATILKGIEGALDVTLEDATLSGEIVLTPDNAGELNVTLDAATLASEGALAIAGTLEQTLAAAMLSAAGELASAFDADAQAFFDACDVEPSAGAKTAINDLVTGLKADAIWDELDAFWPMCMEDSQAGRLNLKSPGNFTLTAVNSPTFTAKFGWAGNQTSSYLNTGWDEATNGSNFTQNDASLGCWVDAGTDTLSTGVRVMGGTNNFIRPWFSLNRLNGSINSNSPNGNGSVTTRFGLSVLNRTNASTMELFRDGASLGTASSTSAAPTADDFFIGGYNNSGSPAGYSDNRISCAFVAGSLGETLQDALYDRLNTFRTAMAAL